MQLFVKVGCFLKSLLGRRPLLVISATLVLVAGFGVVFISLERAELSSSVTLTEPKEQERYPISSAEAFKIGRGESFFDLLKEQGLDVSQASLIVEKARPHIDYRSLRPGQEYFVHRLEGGDLSWIRLNFDATSYVVIERGADQNWEVQQVKDPVSIRLLNFSGEVNTSLWDSAINANMDPALISELTEIFAWQVDFAREVRVGDEWRLTVEQKIAHNKQVGWGRIVAAEYKNEGELHSAVLFRSQGQELGYFMPTGESLKRMFLRSPVRFSRISSRFSRKRFHPVLKTYRPHLGVDYAASTGTPVRSVGDGVVSFARRTRGGGNVLKIRHNSVYQTHYLHLHGYARGIREGKKVKQGQLIGYVGSTGLSTGPHLHFEFYENGRYVDPLGKKFPSADPVPKQLLGEFQLKSELLLASLPEWGPSGRLPSGGFEVVSRELTERLNREALEN